MCSNDCSFKFTLLIHIKQPFQQNIEHRYFTWKKVNFFMFFFLILQLLSRVSIYFNRVAIWYNERIQILSFFCYFLLLFYTACHENEHFLYQDQPYVEFSSFKVWSRLRRCFIILNNWFIISLSNVCTNTIQVDSKCIFSLDNSL